MICAPGNHTATGNMCYQLNMKLCSQLVHVAHTCCTELLLCPVIQPANTLTSEQCPNPQKCTSQPSLDCSSQASSSRTASCAHITQPNQPLVTANRRGNHLGLSVRDHTWCWLSLSQTASLISKRKIQRKANLLCNHTAPKTATIKYPVEHLQRHLAALRLTAASDSTSHPAVP